eukprot:363291-Chlamydomonas_euryale.AAC.21
MADPTVFVIPTQSAPRDCATQSGQGARRRGMVACAWSLLIDVVAVKAAGGHNQVQAGLTCHPPTLHTQHKSSSPFLSTLILSERRLPSAPPWRIPAYTAAGDSNRSLPPLFVIPSGRRLHTDPPWRTRAPAAYLLSPRSG